MKEDEKLLEEQAIEIFSQFTEETKTIFINLNHKTDFTQAVHTFVSNHKVNFVFENEDLRQLENDFRFHCCFFESQCEKAAKNVLNYDKNE